MHNWFYKDKVCLNAIVSIKSASADTDGNDHGSLYSFVPHCHSPLIRSTLSVHAHERSETYVTSHARHGMRMGWGEASARGGINPQVSHRREKQAGMNVRKRQIYFLSVSRQHKQAILRTWSCVETETEVFSPKIAVGTKGSAHGRETCRGLQRREKRFSPHWSRSSQYCISQEG